MFSVMNSNAGKSMPERHSGKAISGLYFKEVPAPLRGEAKTSWMQNWK